jgi:hypothetical protein
LLFGAVVALMVGLLGPTSPVVAAPSPVTLTASITGTPTVGQTLTAVASSVSPNNAALTYKWQTTDPATDIPGATSSTLLLTSDLIGKQVQVVISGTANNRDPGSATSTPTTAVQGLFTAAPVVGLDDSTPVVDAPITASISTDSAPVADSYTYQWFAGGSPIAGATSATYTPTAADVTKQLVAKATAVKANYIGITGDSAATDAVAKASFTTDPSVTITGTAAVGATLTADVSGTVPAPDGYTYQWKADNVDIAGADDPTFTPTLAQQGKTIKVTVTATKAGYNDSAAVTSAATAVIGVGTFTTPPTANLSTTTPKVGDVVTVTPSGASPAADSYAYDWYRIDTLGVRRVIPGAIGSSYTVPYADLTKKLQVEVTAVKAGYTSVTSTSVATTRVNYIALNKTSVTRGQTLGVNAKRLRAGQAYRIFIDGKSVYKGTATSDGSAIRTVGVPTTIGTGTKRVWVSGYNKSGVRDFQVITTVVVK